MNKTKGEGATFEEWFEAYGEHFQEICDENGFVPVCDRELAQTMFNEGWTPHHAAEHDTELMMNG